MSAEQKSVAISFIPRDNAGHTIESPFYGLNSRTHEITKATAYTVAAYCYVAVRYRALKYAEAALMVVEETDDGEEWLPDHDLAEFLDEPTPDFSMGDLLYLTRIYRDMTGMALWVIDADRAGRPARLTPFSGDDFEVKATADRIFGEFKIETRDGPKTKSPEEVIFFREPNPGDWWTGLGWVQVALSSMNLSEQVRGTIRELLKNAIMPPVVVQTDPKWNPSPEDWQRYKDSLDEHSLPHNKGKTLALLGGGTATRVSFPLKDLVPDELLDRVEATVAACSGVPAVVLQFLVGLKNSPWSQMEEARRMGYEDTIIPIWRSDEKTLTRQLLRQVDEDSTHFIRFDQSQILALKADDAKRAEVVAKLVDVWTIDQALIYTGQEPRNDEIGRQIISHARPVAPTAFGGFGGQGQGGPESDEEKQRKALQQKASDYRHASARLFFDLMVSAQERVWETGAAAQLEADRSHLLALANATLREAKAGEPGRSGGQPADPNSVRALLRKIAEDKTLEAEWRARARPLIEATAMHSIHGLSAQLDVPYEILEKALLRYVNAEAAWLVKGVTETTRQAIRDALKEGLAEGESIAQMSKRIADSTAFGLDRARLVARTETTRVTNGAQRSSLSHFQTETKRRVVKEWFAVIDERTRDEHVDLNGEKRGIDEAFSNGLSEPSEPNCRCTLLYSIEDAA